MNSLTHAAKRILIVDDDAQTREGLALVMGAAGHAVRTAANGLEALKAVRACRPDLIVRKKRRQIKRKNKRER